MNRRTWMAAVILGYVTWIGCSIVLAQEQENASVSTQGPGEQRPFWEALFGELEYDVHGFYELRAGWRTRKDPYEKDMSVMENRLQVDITSFTDWADFKVKGDFFGDLVLEQGAFDLREANLFTRPTDYLDLKIGRQILTWGTGDLIFINDLFPKDWQSFFIGRDTEYLKAPSDAGKLSYFNDDLMNVDIVYTPRFDSDRHITGERISYWNGNLGRIAGQDAIVHTDKPDRWFQDDEFAVRLYKNIENVEVAFYGYWGFWKSPGGQTAGGSALFPDLNVYGASLRSAIGKGVGNVEVGYYESADDRSGKNPLINNSEIRFLVGYTQEVAKDFTAAVQYYLEYMMDYSQYKDNPGGPARDRDRHLTTLRLTKLLMNQNLRLSLFTYYSHSDEDVYLRPNLNYKATDNLALELGANVFFGDEPHTFFGQLENNTNIYTAVRYSF
ncbi:MAG: hypothetical protein JXA82_02920 [Sedimentisphaerales bacterium]|nr:hypothetical protein [Sedimentisphaerales bacterium]